MDKADFNPNSYGMGVFPPHVFAILGMKEGRVGCQMGIKIQLG